ncbi:hypothetical protein G6L37_04365 [Agrobacterium rubi]|nr:hypothetical protein [Agrobacterium rubi]NTF24586.1 hypothetical protein [Agrobacterium rubi]
MSYKMKSIDNRRKAKRNLERLLKEIESIPKSDNLAMEAISGVAKASQYYMRLENIVELHIYSEGPERWYADIVFKDVPKGYSNMIGTPVKAPVRTQAEAHEFAKAMLIMLRDTAPLEKKPEEIVFPFDDVNLIIPEAIYQELYGKKEEMGQDFSDEYIVDLMERARARVGGPLTSERMDKASAEDRTAVLVAALICSMSGRIRWPEFVFDEEEDKGSFGMFYPDDMSEDEMKKTFPWKK